MIRARGLRDGVAAGVLGRGCSARAGWLVGGRRRGLPGRPGWLAAMWLLVACASARGGTIYVDGDAPNDPGPGDPTVSDPLEDGSAEHPFDAIQQGINAAVAGDTVEVADGIYTGTGNKDLDFHGKAITVRSASGDPATCIIDCQGSGRGFYFHSGETAAATVAGFTVRNGMVTDSSPGGAMGGAVFCYYSSPTLGNCTITGNTASSTSTAYGAGVYCDSSKSALCACRISENIALGSRSYGAGVYCSLSTCTLTDCAISGNTASGYYFSGGGGLLCSGSGTALIGCTVYGNTAYGGAGVSCYGSPTLANCTISGNAATMYGGGVSCDEYADPKLTHCTITANSAYSGGGVYCNYYSDPTLTNCTVSGNTARAGEGGGVYCALDSSPVLSGCRVDGNSAPNGAGLACRYTYSNPTLTNCTISGNRASTSGGGIYCTSLGPKLDNCVISGNTAYEGGGMSCFYYRPTLTNCAINGNTATGSGGGLYCASSSEPTLINCTMSGNTALSNGGGVYCYSSASPKLANCILWSDTPQEILVSSGTAVATYSDIQGGCTGTGNINVDPGFAFPGDFHLVPGSPCVDAGTNTPTGGLPAQDADGNARPLDGNDDGQTVADMGAYEFNPSVPSIAISPARADFFIAEGQANWESQTLSIRDAGGGVLQWTLNWDAAWLRADTLQGESTGEADTVTLTVDASALSHGAYKTIVTVSDPQTPNNPRIVEVVLYVNRTLRVPGEYATIQAALDAGVTGDEIVVADGTYTGMGNKDLDFRLLSRIRG